jgi:drug/metabolite transporter (DMT)-like permease
MRPLMLALLAALLFGASTPASKVLLGSIPPLQLAGLLYLGAAVATLPLAVRARARRERRRIDRPNAIRLAGSVVLGGTVAPVLVLLALREATSGSVALLLNLEMAATASLGVLFFREHLGVAGWSGVVAGLAAGLMLSIEGGLPGLRAGFLVAAACVAWGFDNHFTALIDAVSPAEAALLKGIVAGSVNLIAGLVLEPSGHVATTVLAALGLGGLSYGVSIVLYVVAAQHLGATRAQVAFASAPFLGAGLSYFVLGEALGMQHAWAGALLAAGVALLVLDRHEHEHRHAALEHVHSHRHDDGHHGHEHPGLTASVRHTHLHSHEEVTHAHRHLPDLHHRHTHRG